jgi:hypothetical protein
MGCLIVIVGLLALILATQWFGKAAVWAFLVAATKFIIALGEKIATSP